MVWLCNLFLLCQSFLLSGVKFSCLSLLALGEIDFTLGKLSVLDNAFIIQIVEFQCGIAAIRVSVLA